MKKVLFICNILSHINAFHLPYIRWFRDNGYEVHIITNAGGASVDFCDKLYDVGIERSPFSLKNISAYRETKRIIERENYDIVHCHTPMGGVIGRLASKGIRKRGSKVLYTVHGFHFYKGASIVNWLFYYTMEKVLAGKTDCIVTINDEDYARAKKCFESKKTKVEKISGIGVDITKYKPADDGETLKESMSYGGKFLMIYAAEFIHRKNHRFLIEAMVSLKERCPDARLLLAGRGELKEKMEAYADKLRVSDVVDFLGFRRDMPELLRMSDLLVSSSLQEGLAINVIEGLASGLPVLVSNVRGNSDSVEEGKNGYTFELCSIEDFCDKVAMLYSDREKCREFSRNALVSSRNFSIENSLSQMENIYRRYMFDSNLDLMKREMIVK